MFDSDDSVSQIHSQSSRIIISIPSTMGTGIASQMGFGSGFLAGSYFGAAQVAPMSIRMGAEMIGGDTGRLAGGILGATIGSALGCATGAALGSAVGAGAETVYNMPFLM